MHKLLICAFLILITFDFFANGQRPFYLGSRQKPSCVNEGDYCSNNLDCCSQSCSNSTNRCATISSNTTDERINGVNLSQQQSDTTTLPSSVAESRFSEAEEAQNCRGINDFCKAGQDCCSKLCFESKCALQNLQCNNIGQKCSSASRGCCDFLTCEKGVCRDRSVFVEGTETFGYQEPEGLNNRFSEVDGNQTVQQQTVPAPCKDVGGKCYKHEECCSPLKCHSFLHQCVT